MNELKAIGKNIADIRKKHNLTQGDLASALNVSTQAVSKWENGVNLPEVSVLVALSQLFRISVDELLLHDRKSVPAEFMMRNEIAPAKKQLHTIPRISRWEPPEGCDMFYSFPAMIAAALCAAEQYDAGNTGAVDYTTLNERFCDILHLSGMGYGFLWREQGNLIEELWRINDFGEMVSHVMDYYGRDYLWLTSKNSTPAEMRRLLVWSIDRGHPVMMEWAGGIPEFSVVTGYEDNGSTVIGWTYCEECAAKQTEEGMFVNPARWQEDLDFKMLIIGAKVEPTYTDKDSIAYAAEVLNRREPGSEEYLGETFAGDVAMQKWLEACQTSEGVHRYFKEMNLYNYALEMNTIYTQWHILSYYRKLSARHSVQMNDVVNQIRIAIGNLSNERKGLGSLQGEEFERACRCHIENVITYRDWLRGWLNDICKLIESEKKRLTESFGDRGSGQSG